MKVASSSVSFAPALARGDLTQLEWLDLCANELELDGVVFEASHFPRLDDEYLAQLKKWAVDLGLTVAALAADTVMEPDGARWLEVASKLGAPLLVTRAATASGSAAAWGLFVEALAARARDAKRANVTLALRDAPATLCIDAADLARTAKDVDSAWLRFAPGAHALAAGSRALGKAVIVQHTIHDVEAFATDGDRDSAALLAGLARFRGFVVLDAIPADTTARDAYHRAIERFTALRAKPDGGATRTNRA